MCRAHRNVFWASQGNAVSFDCMEFDMAKEAFMRTIPLTETCDTT
jgi:hypothetical protein